ncbi:MAG TPA: hypothetical protein VF753_08110 [Terriglobales bacterium]
MLNTKIAQCTHIKLNGFRCGSAALSGQRLCYFHARMRRRAKAKVDAAFPQVLLLEDAESIQASLMQLIDMLLADQIEVNKARVIVSALTLASRNIKNCLISDSVTDLPEADFDRRRTRVAPAKEQPETEEETAAMPEPVLPTAEELAARPRRPSESRAKRHESGFAAGLARAIFTANALSKASGATEAGDEADAAERVSKPPGKAGAGEAAARTGG